MSDNLRWCCKCAHFAPGVRNHKGICRRYPPMVNRDGYFAQPEVDKGNSCGEWKAAELTTSAGPSVAVTQPESEPGDRVRT